MGTIQPIIGLLSTFLVTPQ